jgi:hypothetical protein
MLLEDRQDHKASDEELRRGPVRHIIMSMETLPESDSGCRNLLDVGHGSAVTWIRLSEPRDALRDRK